MYKEKIKEPEHQTQFRENTLKCKVIRLMRMLYGGQLGIAGGIEADRVQCTERECRNRSIAIHQPGMF